MPASFNGMSYLKLRPRTGESTLETLELSFATAKHGGLLVFLTGNQGNLLVQLHHGRIEIKALHDGQSFSIMSHGSNFNDSHWHKVGQALTAYGFARMHARVLLCGATNIRFLAALP